MSVPATSLPTTESAAARARFHLRALADPSSLSRVLEQFALRNLVPERVHCERRAESDELGIDVEISGLGAREADHLARRFRAFPVITGVLLQRE